MSLIKDVRIGEQNWSFTFNKFAKQAGGSVMVASGGTQVLVTVCASREPRSQQDFFPLGVDYTEKLYASGRIPGGYKKREGRPGDPETLVARVIDRQIRPCFPEGFLNDTVVQCTVMSYELGYSPIPLAMVGASTALMISDIPFNGPIAALNIGILDGEFAVNPGQGHVNALDLIVAAKPSALLMVEASADFLSEEKMLEAIAFARKTMQPLWDMQLEVQEKIGKTKMVFTPQEISEHVYNKVKELGSETIKEAFATRAKQERVQKLALAHKTITEAVHGAFEDSEDVSEAVSSAAIAKLKHHYLRSQILDHKQRIDGRAMDAIRDISCEVGILNRSHGSSLFTRGETQALASVTLGAPGDKLRFETLYDKDADEKFMLHYNFPQFSVGEASMPRSTSRREIGHGALARKAFNHTLPDLEDFGYVIRVVSEVLESNGSSSMATVCATSMALMHAGVSLKEPIAGIAMGLVKEGNDYCVLTDILGDEDHLGDMDFKVCGGKDGITALQMDIKIEGISEEILSKALDQAKKARLSILETMHTTIDTPHKISSLAPQIFKLKIPVDKIRDIIGSGGKTIKKIVADTGVQIDIEDSGVISIVSPDSTSAEAAKSIIRNIISDPEVGEIYLGRVTKIVDFGCFVEIKPGLEGLVHISQLENRRVNQVSDIVGEQEEIMVKVIDIDRQGRLKLSRKDAVGLSPTQK
ncbi:MAG: polyribonucleotide nucleotidyltransferase [Proteobacteria bacterium]|nr:polyribonucleotide nucleotidyltransferase [Pseudomonadota bacterium]